MDGCSYLEALSSRQREASGHPEASGQTIVKLRPCTCPILEWLIHDTSYAGYPKAAPFWAEIRMALAKREILPLPESLGPRWNPEPDRDRVTPARGK